MPRSRRARVDDVHELALAMPHVTVEYGPLENPVYQVGRKSFIFFRTPRPDAVDPETGERYPDVIVIWVPSESDKLALIQDPGVTERSCPKSRWRAMASETVAASTPGSACRRS